MVYDGLWEVGDSFRQYKMNVLMWMQKIKFM
jgi:hypothetical protein